MAFTALEAVMDPELDEPITSLGLIRAGDHGDDVEVHLRLPTLLCAKLRIPHGV
jgi:metal-sulfur cluster biosynthetic enzyme